MAVEPRLKKHGRRNAVDEAATVPRRDSPFAQPAGRFDRRQPLVDELDLAVRRIGKGLSEAARALGSLTLAACPIERQTDQKALDVIALGKSGELADQATLVATRERRSRVREEAELIRDGETHTHLPQIDGGHTHP
jgi:hypothetical protein